MSLGSTVFKIMKQRAKLWKTENVQNVLQLVIIVEELYADRGSNFLN